MAVALLVCLLPATTLGQEKDMKTLVDFKNPDALRWTIVNDGVMGGLSRSDLELTDQETVLFTGYLSLDNNGGFASTRARFETLDLSDYGGVVVRVRGDGRTYQLRFRTDGSFDGVSYTAEFGTAEGEWTEVELPFELFRPTFRGYVPRGSGPLDPSRIRQLGILLGDKKEGPFQLEIAWVKAYPPPLT
jgi:monofunctional biosynthetic peptidoglycan transglycosylase